MTRARDLANIADGTFTATDLDLSGTLSVSGDATFDTNTLFVDASADAVGIGTSSPTTGKLVVKTTQSFQPVISLESEVYNGEVGIRFFSNNATPGINYLNFGDTADTNVGQIAYRHNVDAMTFKTNDSERLRIDSSGNVGIGNTDPSSYGVLRVTQSGGGSSNGIAVENATISARLYVDDSDIRHLTAGTTDVINWDISGNVGIGTSSPANTTHIKTDTDGNGITIQRNSTTAGTFSQLGFSASTNDAGTPNVWIRGYRGSTFTDNYMAFGTGSAAGTEAMRIDSSGNVGIGTSVTLLDKLAVSRAQSDTSWSSGAHISLRAASTTDTTGFTGIAYASSFVTNYGWSVGSLRSTGGASSYVFNYHENSDNGTERLRITSNGRVGIGTSSPGATLDVNGSLEVNSSIKSGDASYFQLLNRIDTTDNYDWGTASTAVVSDKQFSLISEQGSFVQALVFSDASTGSNAIFAISSGTDGTFTNRFRIDADGDVTVGGSLSKGSGSFKIQHPLESKKNTHYLVHSFMESPQADNVYRGRVDLIDGKASINIDEASGMTEGTFSALNRDIQCFTSNESGWTAVRGSVSGNILRIEAQDKSCTDTISWLVIGERQDETIINATWTDKKGKVVVEPKKDKKPYEQYAEEISE